jgi:uroporphyrinogen-III synthase
MPGFNGLRVLSFESRRAQEIAQLIRNNGGVPIVAPSTREVDTPSNHEQVVIQKIMARQYDAIIFMTGVGSRALLRAAETLCPVEEFVAALSGTRIVVRGPKPAAVMRELKIPIGLSVPEPNTWREIIATLDANQDEVPVKGRRVLIQEHGEPSSELCAALRQRGAEVTTVRVYRWELPEDIGPLRAAVSEIAAKNVEVVIFTSSVQFDHAFRIAKEIKQSDSFMSGLKHAMIASIGPICSQTLRENGVRVDCEPSHPRMGFLVKEAAERSAAWMEARLQENNNH